MSFKKFQATPQIGSLLRCIRKEIFDFPCEVKSYLNTEHCAISNWNRSIGKQVDYTKMQDIQRKYKSLRASFWLLNDKYIKTCWTSLNNTKMSLIFTQPYESHVLRLYTAKQTSFNAKIYVSTRNIMSSYFCAAK